MGQKRIVRMEGGQPVNVRRIVVKCCAAVLAAVYRVIYLFVRVKPKETRYKISICAIFKDEAPYLREWIEFHKIVGVDHFYLYNHMSSDNYQEVLRSYIAKGEVTLVDWSEEGGQLSAYRDCVNRHGDETQWITFVDIDEFIVPNEDDSIKDFLQRFKNRPVVLIYWKMFGSSGKMNRDVRRSVVEDFTMCEEHYVYRGKIFFNTAFRFIENEGDHRFFPHFMWAGYRKIKLPPVNLFQKICIKSWQPIGKGEFPAQINHYYTRSFQEFQEKISRGDAHRGGKSSHSIEEFRTFDKNCRCEDLLAYKYLPQLKQRLEEE